MDAKPFTPAVPTFFLEYRNGVCKIHLNSYANRSVRYTFVYISLSRPVLSPTVQCWGKKKAILSSEEQMTNDYNNAWNQNFY